MIRSTKKNLESAVKRSIKVDSKNLWFQSRSRLSLPLQFTQQRFNSGTKDGKDDDQKKESKSYLITSGLVFVTGVLAGTVYSSYNISLHPPEALFPRSSITKLYDLSPPVYGGPTDLANAIKDLREFLKEDQISENQSELKDHADTYFNSHHAGPTQISKYIIYPKSTEEVSKIMKICHHYIIPVVPTSGLSSLEGHFIPTRGGICIDCSHMDKIVSIHKDDLDVVVQPGIGWESLDEELAKYNLMIGVDPGPGAMIGGCIANSCSGTKALKYKTMKENVVNLTVVLADGTIIKTKKRSTKSSAGYNLNGLFIGSEGTLGIVTEATLKLHVKPKVEHVAVVSFPTIEDSAKVCAEVVAQGIDVNAMEMVDDKMMMYINRSGELSKKFDELTTLFFKIGGDSKDEIKHRSEKLRILCKQNNNSSFQFAESPEDKEELWSARKVALWSTINYGRANISSDIQIWTTDVAVPISNLPIILKEMKKEIEDSGLNATLVAHAGDGNFHSFLLFKPEQRATAQYLVDRMVKKALELEGTCTGEHAIGYGKREYLVEEMGEDVVALMRKLKMSLDPLRILNPDKIFKIDPSDHAH
ncbi:hypothetical protein PACTADRAFT_74068 [Pachysolen tannophilus NRRL Y-2460]|uniref:D-lactate dehydrogenase (cytochrome) n=1 Tax=Pachysolen tannophilus NRRL Y-2460 TaxID=669874 RepID=A0A1E4U3E3_PACTA|nr:hypothetical protein PACTADRAFT_74068 [Pachysolen tannophilus NRRL Y-2460]